MVTSIIGTNDGSDSYDFKDSRCQDFKIDGSDSYDSYITPGVFIENIGGVDISEIQDSNQDIIRILRNSESKKSGIPDSGISETDGVVRDLLTFRFVSDEIHCFILYVLNIFNEADEDFSGALDILKS